MRYRHSTAAEKAYPVKPYFIFKIGHPHKTRIIILNALGIILGLRKTSESLMGIEPVIF